MPKNLLESWMADPGAEPLPRPQRSLFGNKRTDAGERNESGLVQQQRAHIFPESLWMT